MTMTLVIEAVTNKVILIQIITFIIISPQVVNIILNRNITICHIVFLVEIHILLILTHAV